MSHRMADIAGAVLTDHRHPAHREIKRYVLTRAWANLTVPEQDRVVVALLDGAPLEWALSFVA